MPTKHQLTLGPLEVPKPDLHRTVTGPSAGPDGVPEQTDGVSLLIDGAKDSGCSEKEIYLSLGLPDHSYWGKVKNREKPEPRIGRLTNLPTSAQRAMCKLWAAHLGLTVREGDSKTRAALALARAAVEFIEESA